VASFGCPAIDLGAVPQVPGVAGCARCDVDAFFGFVEADLVLPLAVVDFGGRAAAAVHGNPEAGAVVARFTEGSAHEAQGMVAECDGFGFEFSGSCRAFAGVVLGPEPIGNCRRGFAVHSEFVTVEFDDSAGLVRRVAEALLGRTHLGHAPAHCAKRWHRKRKHHRAKYGSAVHA